MKYKSLILTTISEKINQIQYFALCIRLLHIFTQVFVKFVLVWVKLCSCFKRGFSKFCIDHSYFLQRIFHIFLLAKIYAFADLLTLQYQGNTVAVPKSFDLNTMFTTTRDDNIVYINQNNTSLLTPLVKHTIIQETPYKSKV